MKSKISSTRVVAALVLCISIYASPCLAVDIFTTGEQFDFTDRGPESPSVVYVDNGHTIDFPAFSVGPEGAGELDSFILDVNENNPVTIKYTTSCFLLPLTNATLSVDLGFLFTHQEGIIEYKIKSDGGNSATYVSNPFLEDASSSDVGLTNPGTLVISQDDLGSDIKITVTEGGLIVYYEVKLTGDCVSDYVKIVGKIGSGKGLYSFRGAIGTDTDGHNVGKITIDYNDLDATCTFTPYSSPTYGPDLGSLTDDGDTDAEIPVAYTCSGYDTNGEILSGTISLDPPGTSDQKGSWKDRGVIQVNLPSTPALNISPTLLNSGNVVVDTDTSN